MLKIALKPIFTAALLALTLNALAQQKPSAPPKDKSPHSGGMQAPFAGKAPKMTVEQALQQAVKSDETLAPLDKAFKAAEINLKKKPKDAKTKKAYVDACYQYGHQAMVNGSKQPRVLYRASLALYRRALKVDPKHEPSLKDKQLIEDIYKTMPGGIPQ